MRRWIALAFIIILTALAVILWQTALDPADFTGEWYAAGEQTKYLFQQGIIYCSKYAVPVSDYDAISGAYSFSKDSIVLYASGVKGLEHVRQLYLVENPDESLLCENKDGTGQVFFVRDNRKK